LKNRPRANRVPTFGFDFFGEVAEWLKAEVLKTSDGRKFIRGFESHPLHHSMRLSSALKLGRGPPLFFSGGKPSRSSSALKV
jgi:hypothetical protein